MPTETDSLLTPPSPPMSGFEFYLRSALRDYRRRNCTNAERALVEIDALLRDFTGRPCELPGTPSRA